MNKAEDVVFKHYKDLGKEIQKLHFNYPDFIVENEHYVEVKNLDNYNGSHLSDNQILYFMKLTKPVYVYYVRGGKIDCVEIFRKELVIIPPHTKTINVTFEDEEFDLLDKEKGDMSWRTFILQWIKPKGELK